MDLAGDDVVVRISRALAGTLSVHVLVDGVVHCRLVLCRSVTVSDERPQSHWKRLRRVLRAMGEEKL